METSANVVLPVKVGEAKFAFKFKLLETSPIRSVLAPSAAVARVTSDDKLPETSPIRSVLAPSAAVARVTSDDKLPETSPIRSVLAPSAAVARVTSDDKLPETSPINVVIVVEKLASSPSAAANSFNVSNVPGAESIISPMRVCTNSVVANCVLLVPLLAVGAKGVPVKVGEARFAFKFKEASVASKSAFNFKEASVVSKSAFKFKEASVLIFVIPPIIEELGIESSGYWA